MNPIIEVTNLRKTYGDTVAVDDISFTVNKGEIFGILAVRGHVVGQPVNLAVVALHQLIERMDIALLRLEHQLRIRRPLMLRGNLRGDFFRHLVRIRLYVPQRQILPLIALSISSSLGFLLPARRAAADMICPDWQ